MSVISSMEAIPSRVRLLVSVLSERSMGETEERLRDFLSPETLRRDVAEPIAIFRATLKAAKDMRLVEDVEGKICVRAGVFSRPSKFEDEFLTAIEAALLAPGAEDEHGQTDFARAVAWFLMQSPKTPLKWSVNYKADIEKQLTLPENVRFDLTTRDRWNSFHYWCRFLGYGSVIAGRALVADPSGALRRLLPRALGQEREAPIRTLLGSLAKVSPVFEDGRIRQEIEGDAVPEFRREPQRLSQSTSFALLRLEQEGWLAIDARPDAQAMVLDFGKDAARRVSHLVWKGASK